MKYFFPDGKKLIVRLYFQNTQNFLTSCRSERNIDYRNQKSEELKTKCVAKIIFRLVFLTVFDSILNPTADFQIKSIIGF